MQGTHPQYQATNATVLFLIGMPAAGKTYWGQKIADVTGWAFVDLDTFIVQHIQTSISDIFTKQGESEFRALEHHYLTQLLTTIQPNTVIACGGGTPCFFNNLLLMKDAGIVIYLYADIPTLLDRINSGNDIRPLLKSQHDVAAYLMETLNMRKKFYEQAHFILPAKDISLATFAEIIASCTNRQ